MKSTNPTQADKRLHGVKGQTTELTVKGKYGRAELRLVRGRYEVTAVNYETKQHFNKRFATLPGALVAYDSLKEYWV